MPRTVAVVGLGLIGGSLCLALRRRLPDVRIVGITRREETAQRALADGACDAAGTDRALLAGAEVVVLCTPVDAMPYWLQQCADVAPRALVTDCGSTKAWIVERAAMLLPAGRFLGGHPMAGSETGGYDAADVSLFEGCTWVLTPRADEELAIFASWLGAVEALGAQIEILDPAGHDIAVAWISHLPFALSAALMSAAAVAADWPRAARVAATGFRDMVRLSGGDPAMYAAITTTNAAAMTTVLDALDGELATLRRVLGDSAASGAYFAAAQRRRADWLTQRAAEGRPVPTSTPTP